MQRLSLQVLQCYSSEAPVHDLKNGWCTKRSNPRLSCPTCGIMFQYEYQLKRHMKGAHKGDRKYECTTCGKVFFQKYRLTQHEALHNDAAFKCYLCEPACQLENNQALDEHFNAVHAAQTVLRCRECDHVADDLGKLNKHLSQHAIMGRKMRKSYKCYLCSTATPMENSSSLNEHLAKAHPDQENFRCKECDIYVYSKRGFNQHLARHDASTRPYKCRVCPIRFKASSRQREHEESMHFSEKAKFACSKCGMQFHKKERLQRHEINVHAINHERYACSQCGKTFFYKSILRVHERRDHTKLKGRFKCHLCKDETILDSKHFLKQHLADAHQVLPTYKCEHCSFSAANQKDLNKHLVVIHRSQPVSIKKEPTKPFKCTVCPSKFTEEFSKTHHEASVHKIGNEKGYQVFRRVCWVCKKKTSSDQFEQHMTTEHPNERYDCSECELMFFHKRNLSKHKKSAHGIGRRTTIKSAPVNDELSKTKAYPLRSSRRQQPSSRAQEEINLVQKEANSASITANERAESPKLKKSSNNAVELHKNQTAPSNQQLKVIAKTYKCNLCTTNNTLESRDLLVQHLATHPAQAMYNCDKCSFSVSEIAMFNQHLSTH